ncbi:hypothetical protein ACQEU3_39205 [Spirillospora sp. CA-253888]
MRARLLAWLTEAADVVTQEEEQAARWCGVVDFATWETVQQIRALRPVMYQVVTRLLDDPSLVHFQPVLASRVRRELAVNA